MAELVLAKDSNDQSREVRAFDSANEYRAVDISAVDDVLTYDGKTVPCRGIMVGISGDLVTLNSLGAAVTHPSIVAGVIHPIITGTIVKAGTSAASIVAYF